LAGTVFGEIMSNPSFELKGALMESFDALRVIVSEVFASLGFGDIAILHERVIAMIIKLGAVAAAHYIDKVSVANSADALLVAMINEDESVRAVLTRCSKENMGTVDWGRGCSDTLCDVFRRVIEKLLSVGEVSARSVVLANPALNFLFADDLQKVDEDGDADDDGDSESVEESEAEADADADAGFNVKVERELRAELSRHAYLWKQTTDPAGGKTYWFCRKTNESTWKKPDCLRLIDSEHIFSAVSEPSKMDEDSFRCPSVSDLSEFILSFWSMHKKMKQTPLRQLLWQRNTIF
jgi:hypothetical protein